MAACPYVTAVGGAFGNTPGEEKLSTAQDQGWNIVSGGGFSNIFTEANGFNFTFQTAAVNSWLGSAGSEMSLPGYTLADGTVGRGFPDVSFLSYPLRRN